MAPQIHYVGQDQTMVGNRWSIQIIVKHHILIKCIAIQAFFLTSQAVLFYPIGLLPRKIDLNHIFFSKRALDSSDLKTIRVWI